MSHDPNERIVLARASLTAFYRDPHPAGPSARELVLGHQQMLTEGVLRDSLLGFGVFEFMQAKLGPRDLWRFIEWDFRIIPEWEFRLGRLNDWGADDDND